MGYRFERGKKNFYLNSNIEIHKLQNGIHRINLKLDLNSNIEIHKCIFSCVIYVLIVNLNSNIEIHKLK